MPVILGHGRQRQEDYKFKAFLGHRVNLKPAYITWGDPVSKIK